MSLPAGPARAKLAFLRRRPLIGVGFRGVRGRVDSAFLAGCALITFAFALDTTTTILGGTEARLNDLNPMIRNMSSPTYLLFSFCRFLFAMAILLWFWPSRLDKRFRWPLLVFILPFSYRDAHTYFGAVLVLIIGPMKLAAAIGNRYVVQGEVLFMPDWALVVTGLVLGIIVSNALLYWHSRILRPGSARSLQGFS